MIPFIVLLASTAVIPTYDVQSFCRPSRAGGTALNFNVCDTERTSRDAVAHDWSSLPRKARDDCVAAMNAAPEAGYTELRVCLEIAAPLKSGQASTPK